MVFSTDFRAFSGILKTVNANQKPGSCPCQARPDWARIANDEPLTWAVLESGDWEELRQCPNCNANWLVSWPEALEGGAILCRPRPLGADRLRLVDRGETLRGYLVSRMEEHLGDLKEDKNRCAIAGCPRRCIRRTQYCLDHLIAQRYGRQLSRVAHDLDDDVL